MSNLALFGWIVASSAGFFALQLARPSLRGPRPLLIIVAAGVIAHAVPLAFLREPTGLFNGDVASYLTTAHAVLDRRDVYALGIPEQSTHPYLPFQMYAFAAALKLADVTPVTFFVLVRLPQVAADIACAGLVFAASRRLRGVDHALTDGLSYAICPLPIFVSVYHGQFDSISVLCALSSWYVFAFHARTAGSAALCGVLLGLGILDKSWPVVLLPVLLWGFRGAWERLTLAYVTVAVPLLAVLIYLAAFGGDPGLLREHATGYVGPQNLEGQSLIVARIAQHISSAERALRWDDTHGALVLGVALVATAVIVIARVSPLSAIVAMLVAFNAATTASGPSHLLWIVPFALVAGQRWFVVALVAAATANYVYIGFALCGISCGPAGAFRDLVREYGVWIATTEWSVLATALLWYLSASLAPGHARAHPARVPA